jgi:hypothetical protein
MRTNDGWPSPLQHRLNHVSRICGKVTVSASYKKVGAEGKRSAIECEVQAHDVDNFSAKSSVWIACGEDMTVV